MLEFRSEPGIPASRLGKRGTVTEVIPVHQALEDSHPLSLLQPLPSSPAANSVCSWAHCKPSVGRVKADREVHNGKPRIMVQLKTEQCPSCIPGSYCCSFQRQQWKRYNMMPEHFYLPSRRNMDQPSLLHKSNALTENLTDALKCN